MESYRLLRRRSQDFTITPQETYDATSLLANLKVAEEVCLGLVARIGGNIRAGLNLPSAPSKLSRPFLQRIKAFLPALSIQKQTSLESLLQTALDEEGNVTYDYIPVCAALVLDADSMPF